MMTQLHCLNRHPLIQAQHTDIGKQFKYELGEIEHVANHTVGVKVSTSSVQLSSSERDTIILLVICYRS
jgi:hypothetical protein